MKLFKALLMMTMMSFATTSWAQEVTHVGAGPLHSASLMGALPNTMYDFDCDVIPTRTTFNPAWKILRITHDGGYQYQGSWIWNPGSGRWQLFITCPKTTYPTGGNDFVSGDTIMVYAPDGSAEDTGTITRHVTVQHIGNYYLTVYSYTAKCVGQTP